MSDESTHRPAGDEQREPPGTPPVRPDANESAPPLSDAPTVRMESDGAALDLPGPEVVIDEPTVISNRPPSHAIEATLGPRELGRTLVGRRLAHFELIEFVGGGGMGAVFRATDTMLNRTVAVKVLSRDQGRDEETVRRFQNEAQSAARLDHENIARVYYVGEDDGWYFIVFEFIEGKNLRELVGEQGPMSVERSLQVTLQIVEALEHSATREVVHRDIKPSNVLLTPSGKAKLVDMGLARLRPMTSSEEDLTASGVTLGTFDYISPEQARDPRTADVRSDIYSLGCTWYYMLTGQPPYPEGTVLQKLLSHSSEAVPDPRRLRPDLPPELIPVLHKMLAKRPSERYARPLDLIGDLLLLAERLGIATGVRADGIWMTPRPTLWQQLQFHLPWAIPVGVLLLLALFWDPAWLDGASSQSPLPRFVVPRSARPLIAPSERWEDARSSAEAPPRANTERSADDSDVASVDRPSAMRAAASTTTERTPSPSNAARSDAASGSPVRPGALGTRNGAGSAAEVSTGSSTTSRPASRPETTVLDPAPARNTNDIRSSADETSRRPRGGDTVVSSGNTVVVDPSNEPSAAAGEWIVEDLTEAWRVAQQNPVIETIRIRQQGRIVLSPLTFRLDGRALTIAAADGYAPIFSFRTSSNGADVGGGSMFSVLDGTLELDGLHLEMSVPNETLDGNWSLFELTEGARVRIRNSTLTIHNSYGGRFSNLDDVAVFHCVMPDRGGMLDPDMGQPREACHVELTDCVVRCEATVLRAPEAIPIRFQWTNGLLITSERLALIPGARQLPRDGERIVLTLRQLTAVVDQGLAELSSTPDQAFLMPTEIDSQGCIWSTQRWASLITQSGPHRLSGFMNQLQYRGERNAYEGMESLWKINPLNGSQPESFGFESWRHHWNEDDAVWQQVNWRYPIDKNRPIHQHRVADYGLATNKTRTGGAEAGDASSVDLGFRLHQLPVLPDADLPRLRKTRPLFPD